MHYCISPILINQFVKKKEKCSCIEVIYKQKSFEPLMVLHKKRTRIKKDTNIY